MIAPAPTANHVTVQVRDLHKGYLGQSVLHGINLDVKPGEVFVIMGPSGSGKSVLLKQIIGLETPDSGDILIGGESIRQPGVLAKYRLAMVFQSGALLNSLTVGENVGLYLAEHRLKSPAEIDRIVTAKLDLLGLGGVKNRYPTELSGGMKKRVAIARALVIEPQLILYDEPTSELDPLSAVTISQEITNLQRRSHVTSIAITHDRDLAFGVADRLAMMAEGRIVAVGTAAEIQRHPDPLIQDFLRANFSPNPSPQSL